MPVLTKSEMQKRDYEMDVKVKLWRMFYELRQTHEALKQMPQDNLLVQNVKDRIEIIERCADSLYR